MLRYFLVIPEKQVIPLSGDRITIGQAPADFVRNHSRTHVPTALVHGEHVQLYLFSSEVDAQHASLTLQADGGFAVEDARSQTGTYVNDEPVDSPTPLKQGDRLKIGPYEFFVYCEGALTPEPYSEDESVQFISCRWCGHEVLSTDERCPQCGDLAPGSRAEPGENTYSSENSQAENVPAQIVLDQIAALHQTLNPAKTSKRYCTRCRNWVLAVEQQVQNHLHGPIIFLLFWPWCFVWIVLKVFPSYRCLNCDRVTSFSEAVPLRWLNGRRIVFGSLCAIVLALLTPGVFEAQREQQAAKLFRQGLELIEEERHEEALTRFDRLLELVPNSPQAHFNRGLIHSRLGNDQQALDDFTAVIEDETEQTPASLKADATHQRAHCFDRLGKTDIALADYTRSINLEPDRAEFHACRGRFYASQNSVDDAIAEFREALRLDPRNPHHWQALSFTLYTNERYEQASQIFSEEIESGPSRPDAYRHRSYARMVLGEHELAVADLKEFLKSSPKDPDALRELGRCYLVLESEEEALEPLDAAIEVTASDPDTFYLRAVAHAKLGHRKQALTDIKQAMSLVDPSAGNYELYSRFRDALQAREKILPGWQPLNVL